MAHLLNNCQLFFPKYVCVINQLQGHCMLIDALHFVITMCLKLKEETKIPPTQVNLIHDYGVVLELSLLAFHEKIRF
jgi:hypothetical protein